MTDQLPEEQPAPLSGRVKAAIDVAVDRAITRTLLSLGLDASPGEQAIEVQKDMAWLRSQRTGSSVRSHYYWTTVVSAVVSLATGVAVLAIRQMFFGGH